MPTKDELAKAIECFQSDEWCGDHRQIMWMMHKAGLMLVHHIDSLTQKHDMQRRKLIEAGGIIEGLKKELREQREQYESQIDELDIQRCQAEAVIENIRKDCNSFHRVSNETLNALAAYDATKGEENE